MNATRTGHGRQHRIDWWLAIALTVSAAAFIGIPLYGLFYASPFGLFIAHPPFWQGGIEALVVIALVAFAQMVADARLRLALTLLVTELYLRRHAVDAAALIDLVYLELTVLLGAAIFRVAARNRPQSIVDYGSCFVIGLCAWSVCAWALSALGAGTLHDLRWLCLLLIIPALLARTRPWSAFLFARTAAWPPWSRFCAGLLLGWLLVQFARTAVVIGFDDLWYGLRGNFVLVGAGSAYASQGLVFPVYYFPKLYELYLVPLNGLGSSSVIVGVTIMMCSMLAAIVYELLKKAAIGNAGVRVIGAIACLTIPAIGNQTLQSKGDFLVLLLLALAWLKGAQFIATRAVAPLLWALGLLLLATQARLSAIPFCGALAIAIAYLRWRVRGTPQASPRDELRVAIVALALIVVTSIFVTARTFLLTGMPTIGPDQLFTLWQRLGFELKPPAGTLQWSLALDPSGIGTLFVDFFFRPQLLGHIIISWIGNIWLWMFAIFCIARVTARNHTHLPPAFLWLGSALTLACLYLMFGWAYQVRGGDGNYFIAGVLPAALIGFAAAWSALKEYLLARRAFLIAVCAFSLFHAAYGFMSAGWTSGTSAFDWSMRGSVRSFHTHGIDTVDAAGLGKIYTTLRAQRETQRVVGYVDYVPGFYLPASFESLLAISYSRPEFLDSPKAFEDFIAQNKIDFLIMPLDANSVAAQGISPSVATVARALNDNPDSEKIIDSAYVMYGLSALQRPPATR